MRKASGWHRLFLCLAIAWLIAISFFAVPKFKKFRGWGVAAGCYELAEGQMLDRVQENFPRFNRKAYAKHAAYPKGEYVNNPYFGSMPATPFEIWPQIIHDYSSIDFKDILSEMTLCAEKKVSQAKSASLKRNLSVVLHYYGVLGVLPLFGLYLIGRFVAPWVIDGFKNES
ncbi:hypothetical protein ACR42D_15020 [Desulfovibrio caledoniensis]